MYIFVQLFQIISGGTHQLALLGVTLETTGLYTCQITMDSPPFEFLEKSAQLTVISLPERFPVISGHKGQDYRVGDWVNLNCTCYDSYPAANLRWFINGVEVSLFGLVFVPIGFFKMCYSRPLFLFSVFYIQLTVKCNFKNITFEVNWFNIWPHCD